MNKVLLESKQTWNDGLLVFVLCVSRLSEKILICGCFSLTQGSCIKISGSSKILTNTAASFFSNFLRVACKTLLRAALCFCRDCHRT
jgi:hypothetical protein